MISATIYTDNGDFGIDKSYGTREWFRIALRPLWYDWHEAAGHAASIDEYIDQCLSTHLVALDEDEATEFKLLNTGEAVRRNL